MVARKSGVRISRGSFVSSHRAVHASRFRASSVPQKSVSNWTAMHPCIRTMFISLAVGTASVFASLFYYIQIAEATRPILEARAVALGTETLLPSDSPFLGMVYDLERQDIASSIKPTPKGYLRVRAEEEGVDADLLNRIATCESRWHMVQNKKSTAFGYFQILDGTEKLTPQYREGLRKDDPYVNIDMAIFLFKKYGTLPWTESMPCWSN